MKNFRIITYLLFIAIFTMPSSALAFGQMTEPINIDNALRGEKIQQEIITVNSEKTPIIVKFASEGQISGWAEFFEGSDLKNKITTSTIPSQGTLSAVALINVPEDIENGEYRGAISVYRMADVSVGANESGAAVLQKIDREVTIVVSDNEEIDFRGTSVIPASYDLSAGEPLDVRIIYDNQGNVTVAPQVRIKIKKDDKNIHDVIYPYPEEEPKVNPMSQHEADPISVQTSDWEDGKYSAELGLYHKDELLFEKEFQFAVTDKNIDSTGIFGAIDPSIWFLIFTLLILVLVMWQVKRKYLIRA